MTTELLPPAVDPTADAEDRVDVRAWIERLLKDGPVSFIEVNRLFKGAEERTGAVGGTHNGTIASADQITGELVEIMRDDADAWGGIQAYMCYAYRPDDDPKWALFRGKYQKRAKFEFHGKHEAPKDREASETGKLIAESFAAQSFRHTERMHEITLSAVSKLREIDESEKRRLYKRIGELEEREDAERRATLELQSQKTRDQIELEKIKREDRMHEMTYGLLNMAAPVVMSRLLPAGVGEPVREPDTVRELFQSLSMAQINRLRSECGFDPAQLAIVATLHEGFSAGKIPALSGEQMKRFLESMRPAHWDAVEKILRPDQIELVKKILAAYAENPSTTNGAAAQAS